MFRPELFSLTDLYFPKLRDTARLELLQHSGIQETHPPAAPPQVWGVPCEDRIGTGPPLASTEAGPSRYGPHIPLELQVIPPQDVGSSKNLSSYTSILGDT